MQSIKQHLKLIMGFICYLVTIIYSFSALAYDAYNYYYVEPINTKVLRFCPPWIQSLDGVYLGLSLGSDAYRTRQTFSLRASPTLLMNGSTIHSLNGVDGNVFLGYGRYFNWFYIAGEIFADNSNAYDRLTISSYYSNIAVHGGYGASILPGFKVNNFGMIYARFGYIRTFFHYHENAFLLPQVDRTEWENGLQLGIGVQSTICGSWSARIEYDYTEYTRFASSIETLFSPSAHVVSVGVLYSFG